MPRYRGWNVTSLIEFVNERTPLFPPFGRLAMVAVLFLLAVLASHVAGRVATFIVDRDQRRHRGALDDSGVISSLKQRETSISLARTTVSLVAYGLFALLSLGIVIGADRVGTVLGASFLIVLLAFSAQRFLMDVIAGLLMYHERWFRIGDTVVIAPWNLQGIVEAMTLRAVQVRGIGGEVMRVANSEIKAVSVLPKGFRRLDAELFVTDSERGCELVDDVARILPHGPTHFVRRPEVVEVERLEDDLHRIRAQASVPLGREWLADDLLPKLCRECADEGLLAHGPIVTWTDEHAEHRFARSTGLFVRG
jgi:moderate conductance mechanosensitive channel